MTTETPTFDAFEQRLAAVLIDRSSEVAVPVDGLDRVNARVAHRRRVRRGTWVAAAAAVVLVAGVLGVALRSTDTDSAPYVDTSTVIDAGGMPLLGFDDDGWMVTSYTPGGGYGVVQDRAGLSPNAIVLQVRRADSAYPGANVQVEIDRSEIIGDRSVDVGTATTIDGRGVLTYRSPVLTWVPAPGYQASLLGNSSLLPGSIVELRAAFERVATVDLSTWEQHLRSETSPVASPSEQPMLALLPPAGSTRLISVSGDAVLADIESLATPGRGRLTRLTNGLVVDQTTTTPVQVRGTEGRFLEGSADSASQLSWTEGSETYLLAVTWGTSPAEAARLAAQLDRPSAEQWNDLLFPDEPVDLSLLVADPATSPGS